MSQFKFQLSPVLVGKKHGWALERLYFQTGFANPSRTSVGTFFTQKAARAAVAHLLRKPIMLGAKQVNGEVARG